jgi:hypothetical protein
MMWKKFYTLENEADDGSGGGAGAGGTSDAPAGESSDSGMGGSDSTVNWADMDASFDADDLDVEGDLVIEGGGSESQPSSQPAAPAAPTPQAAPAPVPAASSPAAPPQAAQAPAPQPAQSTPPPQTQVQPQAAEPQVAPEVYQNWRTNRLTELEQHYTFNEDESAALLTEPELVLPKLAAKVHMEVLENSMRAMQAMVPVMMQQVQHHAQVNTQAQSLFTSINPDLADPRFEPVIIQLGQTFRQMNRTAGPEEASRAIGNLVRAALNMQAPGQAPQQPQGHAPAAAPFVPARGGGGGGQRPSTSSNPFEQLASELLADDNDGW